MFKKNVCAATASTVYQYTDDFDGAYDSLGAQMVMDLYFCRVVWCVHNNISDNSGWMTHTILDMFDADMSSPNSKISRHCLVMLNTPHYSEKGSI